MREGLAGVSLVNLLCRELGRKVNFEWILGQRMFSKRKIGIWGKLEHQKTEEKAKYLKKYYTLKIENPRYIGGYFWWYFKQDMVPKSKPLWNVLNKIILK